MLALMAPNEALIDSGIASLPGFTGFGNITAQGGTAGEATTVCVYHSRSDLFLEGDEASHVLEVMEGVICAYRLLPDGHRHVVSFYFPGDLLGYCCMASHAFSAQALTTVRVRRIPRHAVDRMVEMKPDFARRLLKIAANELSATRNHLLCLASKSAEAKMASFLVALSHRNATSGEDANRINLPMTRVDIGDYLGLTIETVSRTLSKLKRAGIISLPRTSVVVIRQPAELSDIAQN